MNVGVKVWSDPFYGKGYRLNCIGTAIGGNYNVPNATKDHQVRQNQWIDDYGVYQTVAPDSNQMLVSAPASYGFQRIDNKDFVRKGDIREIYDFGSPFHAATVTSDGDVTGEYNYANGLSLIDGTGQALRRESTYPGGKGSHYYTYVGTPSETEHRARLFNDVNKQKYEQMMQDYAAWQQMMRNKEAMDRQALTFATSSVDIPADWRPRKVSQ